MSGYTRSFVRLLWAIIIAQFAIIAVLLGGLSNEYLSNTYMQEWISAHVPLLSVFLHGEFDSLLIGIAIGATFLLIQRRIGETKTEPDIIPPAQYPTATPSPTPPRMAQDMTRLDDPSPDPPAPIKKTRSTKKQAKDTGSEIDKTDL